MINTNPTGDITNHIGMYDIQLSKTLFFVPDDMQSYKYLCSNINTKISNNNVVCIIPLVHESFINMLNLTMIG